MRAAALLVLAACGGQPALANAPRPDPAVIAGAAAALAGAAVLANPNAPTPEKRVDDNMKGVEVDESVPADVLDRLDQGSAAPAPATTSTKPAPKRQGPPPKIPSPTDAAKRQLDDGQ